MKIHIKSTSEKIPLFCDMEIIGRYETSADSISRQFDKTAVAHGLLCFWSNF